MGRQQTFWSKLIRRMSLPKDGRLALGEADSASPERQRIEASSSPQVTRVEQDCCAYQDCQCHHSNSSVESSLDLLLAIRRAR
jgi:hypothetical protein